MGYDCHFRQQAAATPTRWDVVNSTLWNLAFSGRACTSCCCCFSLSHCYSDCEILLNTQGEHTSSPGHFPPNNIPPKNIPSYMTRPTSQSQLHQNQTPLTWLPAATSPVCCSYSESPKPGCLFSNCWFEHSCYCFHKNTKVFTKRHKAIFCLNKDRYLH